MAPPLVVDPKALDSAGQTMTIQAGELGKAVETLVTALSGCAGMCGNDPAGIIHARAYDRSAKSMLEAMVDLTNGMARTGDAVRTSAVNYSLAEVASNTHGHGGPPLPAATPTPATSAPLAPSAQGTFDSAPPGWSLVEPFLGMIWPNGDSGRLRAAAEAWSAAGSAFLATEAEMIGAFGVVAGQHIPEGDKIGQAVNTSSTNSTTLFNQCVTVSSNLIDYAGQIDAVHAAILDLLSRIINPLTGIREVWDIITGDDNDEIKKIADDIRVVIDNFKAEVSALAQVLAPIVAAAEAVISAMGQYLKMELEQFGDAAYNVLAEAVNSAASFGDAALHNPLDAAAMVGGAAMMGLGAGLEVPGVLLDATGVGAIGGVPLNLAGVGLMAGGATLAGGGAIDLSQHVTENGVTVMPTHIGRPGEGVDRGDGRDPYGHITGRQGGGYARQREAEGIENYEDRNPGRWVTTEQRKATVEGGASGGRFYDGLGRLPDGTYEGIEVKSGGASLSPGQRAFDSQVSEAHPAYVTITNEQGVVETVKVTRVRVETVPGE